MKFTQPVSMICSEEQYKRDLKNPLFAMGYNERSICNFPTFTMLVSNNNNISGKLANVDNGCAKDFGRYFISEYNPELFLALAGITDKTNGNIGEYWKYTGVTYTGFIEGKLYKQKQDTILINSAFINELGGDNGFHPTNHKYFTKATKEQIINYFTKQPKKSMDKITVKKSEFKKLHMLACTEWKEKLTKIIADGFLYSDTIDFTEDFVTEMRNACTKEQLIVFKEIFKDFDVLSVNKKYKDREWFGTNAGSAHITPRTAGEYQGIAFYLTNALNWELKKDSVGNTVLIPTEKNK